MENSFRNLNSLDSLIYLFLKYYVWVLYMGLLYFSLLFNYEDRNYIPYLFWKFHTINTHMFARQELKKTVSVYGVHVEYNCNIYVDIQYMNGI